MKEICEEIDVPCYLLVWHGINVSDKSPTGGRSFDQFNFARSTVGFVYGTTTVSSFGFNDHKNCSHIFSDPPEPAGKKSKATIGLSWDPQLRSVGVAYWLW